MISRHPRIICTSFVSRGEELGDANVLDRDIRRTEGYVVNVVAKVMNGFRHVVCCVSATSCIVYCDELYYVILYVILGHSVAMSHIPCNP